MIDSCQHDWLYTGMIKLIHPPLYVLKCAYCGEEKNVPFFEMIGKKMLGMQNIEAVQDQTLDD